MSVLAFGLFMAKILLIDDEKIVRDTLADFLGTAGHEVAAVDGGRAALDLVAQSPFDLMIVDVFMPDMDGIELVQQLFDIDPKAPIVVISGGAGVLSPTWATKLTQVFGVKYTLTKPIDMADFLSAVDAALDGREDSDPENSSSKQLER